MKVAGRKSKTREYNEEEQRLVASHPTPHGRSVCDYLLYLYQGEGSKIQVEFYTGEKGKALQKSFSAFEC